MVVKNNVVYKINSDVLTFDIIDDHILFLNHLTHTFSVSIKRTSSSAFATDALARCNSSFKGTAESGSKMVPIPAALQQYILIKCGTKSWRKCKRISSNLITFQFFTNI